MKKILFILVVASTLTQVAYSQKAVLDITCMETLIANHKVRHSYIFLFTRNKKLTRNKLLDR